MIKFTTVCEDNRYLNFNMHDVKKKYERHRSNAL